MAKSPIEKAAYEAARHHTTLTTFGAVVALLEGGTVPGGCGADRAVQQIRRVCLAEMKRQLKKYDRQMERVVAAQQTKDDGQ